MSDARPIANVNALAGDLRGLSALRNTATADPKAAAREAARQFEALFMRELLKSMRAASATSGLFDNEASKLGTEMLDNQLAELTVGGRGSLSEMIARQIERQMGSLPGPLPKTSSVSPAPIDVPGAGALPRIPDKAAAEFVNRHQTDAANAQAQSGIPAAFMIAQAAHETGWGRKEIRHPDGATSHNLFGIKADTGWNGPVAEVTTTEFVDGQPRKLVQRFRSYASYADSFADYARLINHSPRYKAVAAAAGDSRNFAQGLQRAGYATDPDYADKLTRVINTTLRLQRAAI
jgi:flagellar protein FlgJ